MSTKSKIDSEFSRVSVGKIRKIWQIGSKYFTLVGARFFREIYETSFVAAVKDINFQKSKNLPLQTLLFSCLKFVSRKNRYAMKILEDFTEGNSRKS